jgi:hypothetical protein
MEMVSGDWKAEGLGSFPTQEEAMLAAEMADALKGGREPLDWHRGSIRTEPRPGHVYVISEYMREPHWRVEYTGPEGTWEWSGDTQEAAKAASQADWDQREKAL